MNIRRFALATLAVVGFATGASAMSGVYERPMNAHNFEAYVGAEAPHIITDPHHVLSTGDTRTTATGGPSGGIN